jgi:hypothetical protein
MRKDVTSIKPGHQTTGNVRMIRSHELSFTLFLHQEEYTFGEHPRKAYNPECLVPTVKYGAGSAMVWAVISWCSVVPIIILHGQIIARKYVNIIFEQRCSFPR